MQSKVETAQEGTMPGIPTSFLLWQKPPGRLNGGNSPRNGQIHPTRGHWALGAIESLDLMNPEIVTLGCLILGIIISREKKARWRSLGFCVWRSAGGPLIQHLLLLYIFMHMQILCVCWPLLGAGRRQAGNIKGEWVTTE